jgi:tRNA threonylcarbamoyl adenosine modification protein YeaZ
MKPDALILAIETSGAAGSVAMLRGGETLAERRFDPGMRGGNLVHPGVVAVIEAAGGVRPDLVAAGIGPGSYTGARIGVVFAKMFAFARGLPLIGVCALEAVACRVLPAGRSAVLMTANPDRAYAAIYATRGERPAEILREPAFVSRSAFLAGLGGGEAVIELPPEQAWAADVGRVAWLRTSAGVVPDDPGPLEPLYLQAPSPERIASA